MMPSMYWYYSTLERQECFKQCAEHIPALGIVNERVPIQLAQCWFYELAISNATIIINVFLQIKYTEAIL